MPSALTRSLLTRGVATTGKTIAWKAFPVGGVLPAISTSGKHTSGPFPFCRWVDAIGAEAVSVTWFSIEAAAHLSSVSLIVSVPLSYVD